ncbi:carbohydrate ABC transporter permease [Nocardiopsis coralli]|uniref:carbohydrate ABC transporter permease n=1 Tax=Nocardiopsis coralli TaxID=2772213 RepID=UPI001F17E5CB|nr:sugar ABC transporter permease [Nocardiopsis coralli]
MGPLPWIGPALLLIFAVVLWPAVEMVRTSFSEIALTGMVRGPAGLDNYRTLLAEPELVPVVLRTVVWVAGIVFFTVVLGLLLAQLLQQHFPGRRVVRWLILLPWAASVVMTAIVWRWMLDYFYGLVNGLLTRPLPLIGPVLDGPVDWLGQASTALPWMMWVAVFVSLPFTIYVIIAGLSAIPQEVYEAARMDGASAWQAYVGITLPMLRPSILIATVINIINVFNSFPIIWVMTGGGPASATDTTTTFMYKLAFVRNDVGASAAMAVVNFLLVLVVVLVYLRIVRKRGMEV